MIFLRILVLSLIALGMANAGCNVNSPVFTPNPADYPCHNVDGSADPNAVLCEYIAGKASCCRENFACKPAPVWCEFMGDPNWETNQPLESAKLPQREGRMP